MLLIRVSRPVTVVAALAALATVVAVVEPARAQSAPPVVTVPQVTAHGRGEIDVVPDRGEITFQVETRANDGARAGGTNAGVARAVLDTLRRGFGLADRDVATIGYNLAPQMVYSNDGQAPRVSGYVATSSVRVRTSDLGKVGAMIDAALAKGATGIAGLSFYVANSDDARRKALTAAVENARRDAEAMAVAAGGKLGQLIDIVTEPEEYYRPMNTMLMAAARAPQATPIEAGEQKVTASVTARWRVVLPGQ